MKHTIKLLLPATLLIFMVGVLGCVDHQERYADPEWLGGSTIETLEKRGDYTIFLKLMEKADYTEPIQKQLFSLFVPNDEAFETYFQKAGITSVDAMSEEDAFQLFTLHVLRNPRSRYNLIYEYVWEEEQGPNGEYAGLFLRKETPSTNKPYKELVLYDPKFKGRTLNVYMYNKYVPLWSKDYFEDYFSATDGSDYLFMYPGSHYDNNSILKDKAMNWHNAMVLPNPDIPTELEVRTSNGFIYFIDQVVAPMPSLEEYLRDNQDKYGLFYRLMQRFATYGIARINEKREPEYPKVYQQIPNIADDRGPGTGPEVRMKDMFTAFIPRDDIFQQYLDQKVLKTYHIDSIPEITLSYILRSHINKSLGLLSKMEKGFFNDFGDPLTILKSDINSGFMCSNGVIYDMKKVLEPDAFQSVVGDLFFDARYSTFLYALNEANLITTISSPEQEVTLFAPSNNQLEAAGIRYNSVELQMEFKGPDEVWREMKLLDIIRVVQDHIVYEKIADLSGEGYVRMSSGNFIHYNNNSIEGPENQFINDSVMVLETFEKGENGVLHNINNMVKSRYYTMGKLIWNDPEISDFASLLDKTGLLNRRLRDPLTKELTPYLKFYGEAEQWTAFIPTNEAMAKAREAGLVPSTDAIERPALLDFLLYHFLRDKAIFDDGNPSGTGVFSSDKLAPVTIYGPKYDPLIVNNTKNNMVVTDNSGQQVTVEHAMANNLAQKSVVHKINAILKY